MAEHSPPVSGIAQADWHRTPTVVQEFVRQQQQRIATLEKRLEQLEARLNQNSTNSSKPPSSDNPYEKPKPAPPSGSGKAGAGQTPGKAGGKKGHPGRGPQLLSPTAEQHIQPSHCRCGSTAFTDLGVYHTHQQIELPEDFKVPAFGGSIFGGLLLIAVGTALLLNTRFDISFVWVEDWWPMAPILLGVYLLFKAIQERSAAPSSSSSSLDSLDSN